MRPHSFGCVLTISTTFENVFAIPIGFSEHHNVWVPIFLEGHIGHSPLRLSVLKIVRNLILLIL